MLTCISHLHPQFWCSVSTRNIPLPLQILPDPLFLQQCVGFFCTRFQSLVSSKLKTHLTLDHDWENQRVEQTSHSIIDYSSISFTESSQQWEWVLWLYYSMPLFKVAVGQTWLNISTKVTSGKEFHSTDVQLVFKGTNPGFTDQWYPNKCLNGFADGWEQMKSLKTVIIVGHNLNQCR